MSTPISYENTFQVYLMVDENLLLVILYYFTGESWDVDTSIALPCDVEIVGLELWEFLEEFNQRNVVILGNT